MRIVSWNCAQAAHRKLSAILDLQPDVAVIAECAHPDILAKKAKYFRPSSSDWVGDNPHKGLAVFTFGSYSMTRAANWDPSLRYFLPACVSGPESVNLLATWAFSRSDPPTAIPNSPSLRDAVEHYRDFLSSTVAVVAGDFNAGVRWDAGGRFPFSAVADELGRLGFKSAVHSSKEWRFGEETQPTFFDRTRKDMEFHIDYVFVKQQSLQPPRASVGLREHWRPLSDHMPIIVELGATSS